MIGTVVVVVAMLFVGATVVLPDLRSDLLTPPQS